MSDINRRDFFRGAAVSSIGLGSALEGLDQKAKQAAKPQTKPATTQKGQTKPPPQRKEAPRKPLPISCGVIGLGPRGRDILAALARIGEPTKVVAICDTFTAPKFIQRATEIAPRAEVMTDYKALLARNDIQAIFIATPSHQHKQIAIDAIKAGKHIYCEAPLAHTVEDAREIANAAKDAKTIFHPGLQQRCNGQTLHVFNFVRAARLGTLTGGRAQWHKRTSWRTIWPDSKREQEINWRLSQETSPGLLGEVGIHQIDRANMYYKALPRAVTGFGAILEHNQDGRDVADTVQCTFEYPRNIRFTYDATLTSSFEDEYEMFMGTEATMITRDLFGWYFKESDSTQYGWEVFARKDQYQVGVPANKTGLQLGVGIAMVADATKQLALGQQPGEVGTDISKSALFQSVDVFLQSAIAGKPVFAREPTSEHPNPILAPTIIEGFQATIIALKANEAVVTKSRVEIPKDLYEL
jgi:predicted dehydrogenase